MKSHSKYIHRSAYLLMFNALLFGSCERQETASPDFDISTEKTTYQVNEPILFKINGGADIITFYSGEPGQEYKYRDRFTVEGTPQLTFTSTAQNAIQNGTLKVMASTDFNGTYNAENIELATWTDITSKATLSSGSADTPSGEVTLSEFNLNNIPVYLAFRYASEQSSTAPQPTWTIKNVSIDNKTSDGSTVSIANMANLTWGAVNLSNTNSWTYNTTQAQIVGGTVNSIASEDWLITMPLQLNRVQRSFGVDAKMSPTAKQSSYEFAGFSLPGKYIVTFEAINASKWDKKKTVKELTITVQ